MTPVKRELSADSELRSIAQGIPHDPLSAARQATELLKKAPNHPLATLLLGAARRVGGDAAAALKVLQPLVRRCPDWAIAHYELGLAFGNANRGDKAIAALQKAVQLNPTLADAWHALGDQLTVDGQAAMAEAAYVREIELTVGDPGVRAAAIALREDQISKAERLLQNHLLAHPDDAFAIRLFAEIATRHSRFDDAELLLARCLALQPDFAAARLNYAFVLHRQNKSAEALAQINLLLSADPRNPDYNNLKAAVIERIGDYDQAIGIYGEVLNAYPSQAKIWLSYGHALKIVGREADGIHAYEKSIELMPNLGEAYWSLANLKTVRFKNSQIYAMRKQLARTDISEEDRFHLHFALGKALEDAAEFSESFQHYDEGNRRRLAANPYDPEEMTSHVRISKGMLNASFFAARADFGAPAPDPIFIVGMPRAGSTLLEQILASHSLVEGTSELPDIPTMIAALAEARGRQVGVGYPELMKDMDAAQFRALGEQYISRTRIQRKTEAPFFIDKLPNNFAHVGFIHLMLPHAKIIDARRHPMGCCFSLFKQHFARGQNFTYSLNDIGRYYRDYVELMAHFDQVLPGKVYRVHYEAMIDDTDAEIRRLLSFCKLPFEETCLRFYASKRAVRTASSQQVRLPIFRQGLDDWRNYEAWLSPLKAALGPVLTSYPKAPNY